MTDTITAWIVELSHEVKEMRLTLDALAKRVDALDTAAGAKIGEMRSQQDSFHGELVLLTSRVQEMETRSKTRGS